MRMGILEQVLSGGGGGSAPSSVPIYKGLLYDGTNKTVGNDYTFSGKDIGVAHADRLVLVAVCRVAAATGAPKINGVSMSLMGEIVNAFGISLYGLVVPAGTTCDFSYTVAGSNQVEFLASYWIAYPVSSTPIDVVSQTGSAGIITASNLAAEADGFAIVLGAKNAPGSYAIATWSGTGTLISNASIESEGFIWNPCMITGMALETTGDITADGSSGSRAILGVSWGASS